MHHKHAEFNFFHSDCAARVLIQLTPRSYTFSLENWSIPKLQHFTPHPKLSALAVCFFLTECVLCYTNNWDCLSCWAIRRLRWITGNECSLWHLCNAFFSVIPMAVVPWGLWDRLCQRCTVWGLERPITDRHAHACCFTVFVWDTKDWGLFVRACLCVGIKDSRRKNSDPTGPGDLNSAADVMMLKSLGECV